jgi:PAS domain S-box-containing protein
MNRLIHGIKQYLQVVAEALPKGTRLPEAVWRKRHRLFVVFLWLHALFMPVVASVFAHSLMESVVAGLILVPFPLLAGLTALNRSSRAAIVSLGYATASGLLVHLSGGYVEMHFHYFVMVTFLALYQDWVPFLISITFVVLQHGVGGVLFPHSVYNHPDAFAHPWKWAVIHAVFLGSACIGCFIAWKNNERSVEAFRQANDTLKEFLGASELQNRSIVDTALDAVITKDAAGMIREWNPQAEIIFGWSKNEAVGRPLVSTIIPEHYREAYLRAVQPLKHSWVPGQKPVPNNRIEITALHRDGHEFPVELSISPVRTGSNVIFNAFIRDISERKQIESSLIYAKDEAERANQAKSEFLSSMSHELRTPMNAILGFAQLLESNAGEPLTENQEESVQQILKGGYHLLDLINEVLDLAKIESGNVTLSVESVAVGPTIEEVLALVGPMAEARRIQVYDQTTPHHNWHVQADHLRLKQVLLNLLSNAVKYNHEAGSVWVVSQISTNGGLQIRVTDTGPGIPQNHLQSLFEPFNRFGADKTEVEGTGIGLTITKRLIELMGGTISVSSSVGEGSSFSVELPIDPISPVDYAGPVEAAPEATRSVLYVEDNPSNLALVKNILSRRAGIRLLTAPQAQLGLDLARSHRPDLIILDINLPGLDGYELLKLLRSFDETRSIPVIALSANATPRDLERGRIAGFARYLIKPLDVPLFLDTIDAFLNDPALAQAEPAHSG